MNWPKFILIFNIFFVFISSSFLKAQTEFEPFWGIHNCPESQDVRALGVDSTDILYAAVWGDGVYKSTDDGVEWQKVSNGLTNLFVTCLEIDTSGIVYVGTYGSGIFKSTNGGELWTQLSTEYLNDLNVKAIAVYSNGNILAGTYGGGIARMDSSNKWRVLNNHLNFLDVNCIVIPQENYIVIGTNGGGIFRSSDDGASWVKVNSGLRSYTITDMCIGRDGDIYAATLGGGVHVSLQNGTGWQVYFDKGNHPLNANCIVEYDFEEPIVGTIDRGVVRCDRDFGGYDPWRNTDRSTLGVNDIIRNSKGYIFIVQPYKGIMRSRDGGFEYDYETVQYFNMRFYNDTHKEVNITQGITPLWAGENGLMLCSSYRGGIYRSTNKGYEWELITLNGTQIYCFSMDSGGNLYAATNSGAYKSTDKGISWNNIGWADNIYSIALNDDGDIFITDTLLRRSTNGGTTWTALGLCYKDFLLDFIAIGPNGNLYCNQRTEILDTNNIPPMGLGMSTDNGDTWEYILPDSILVYEIAFKGDSLFVGADNGLYISADFGNSWRVETFGCTDLARVTEVLVSDDGDLIVFEHMHEYIMKSTDNGFIWDTLHRGIVRSYLRDVVINNEGDLFATTTLLYRAIANKDLLVPEIVYPKDEIGGQPRYATLDWNSVHNADLYEVQISPDVNFADENIEEYAIVSATDWKLLYPLEYNSRYFWRVRSKRNRSVSGWSETGSFQTETAPPGLIFPEPGQFGMDTVFSFSWHKVEGAYGYEIQVSTNEYFDNIVEQNKDISDSTYEIKGLELDKDYFWRVRALSSKGSSGWATYRKFTTKLPAPTLKKPFDDAFVPYNLVSFSWNTIEKADIYDIQVARDSFFNDIVFDGPADTDSTHKLSTLTYGLDYYWRIKGRNDTNFSYWSEVWKFTTDLEAATLVSPDDYSTNIEIPVEFIWDASKDATSFHFQLASDAGFDDIIYELNGLTDKKLLYEESLPFGTYYWRVRFYVDDLPGLWAEPWSFTMNPGYVELLKPETNANNVSDDDWFRWKGPETADVYHLQVALDEGFTDIIFERKELTSQSIQVSQAGLEVAVEYYWRVRLITDGVSGFWSDIYNFLMGLNAPTLLYPQNEAEDVNANCEFSWQSVSQAEFYTLQIAKDKKFSDIVHDLENIPDNKKTVTLDSGTTYYWHVKGTYSEGEGSWSYTRSLKTEGKPSSIFDRPIIIENVSVTPNPFYHDAEISFYLESCSNITINVVDANGKLVSELMNQKHSPGMIKYIWQPENISPGVYYLRIKAGAGEYVKKIILIR